MNNDSFTSGFFKEDTYPNDTAITDIQEIYTSASGYNQLFRCHRYGKLHILKALQPMYRRTVFCEQALEKEFNIGYQLEHPHICRTLSWEKGLFVGTLYPIGICGWGNFERVYAAGKTEFSIGD